MKFLKNGTPDLSRVQVSLKHFIRDWSEGGAVGRTRTFSPILDVLNELDPGQRAEMKILVPGCGLGRLAWEISQLGCFTRLALPQTRPLST